ncbi:MAG: hypothetical protein M3Y60_12835 [Bacteroidota bacterium]|nr:hypothetical protein [Bacteroidota bacterium]
MADERNLELLDDYLTNRMSDEDRSAFEQKMKADPDLQHELALQKRLIDGIKSARVAELKSMLNNVPVPAAGTGSTLAGKVIFGTVVTLMIAAAALWYFGEDEAAVPEQKANIEQQRQPPSQKPAEPVAEPEKDEQKQESVAIEKQAVEADKNQTSAGTEHSKPSLAKRPAPLAAPGAKKSDEPAGEKPAIDVFTPENETDNSGDANTEIGRPGSTRGNSSLVVETERNNGRYTFHYQFRDGKLFLFGPFEKNLYEILEFFTDEKRTVFLFYKDQYYLLGEADTQVRPLTPITDPALIQKLKDQRKAK